MFVVLRVYVCEYVCVCVSCSQEVEERDALVQLVNAQSKELERLRAQVSALRRKDTSVYV